MKQAFFVSLAALAVMMTGCGSEMEEAGAEDSEPVSSQEAPLTSQETAVMAAASGSGWSWQYSSVIGHEVYRLLKGGELRGVCDVKTSGDASVTLSDRDPDGLGQRVYWKVSGGSWRRCDNEGGNGSSRTCNLPDGKSITYQFCMKNNDTIVACAPVDAVNT